MPRERYPPSSSTAPDGSTTSTSALCARAPGVGLQLLTRARGALMRPRARLALPWGSSSGTASAVSTSTGASMSMASPTRPLAFFSRTTKAPTLRSRRLGAGCTSGGRPSLSAASSACGVGSGSSSIRRGDTSPSRRMCTRTATWHPSKFPYALTPPPGVCVASSTLVGSCNFPRLVQTKTDSS